MYFRAANNFLAANFVLEAANIFWSETRMALLSPKYVKFILFNYISLYKVPPYQKIINNNILPALKLPS